LNTTEPQSKSNGVSQNGHPDKSLSKEAETQNDASVKDHSSVSGIVDAILEVGRQRNALLEQMSAALQSGNEKQALTFARRLCGLELWKET
jgi:hypothetical protein